ncbi:CDP-diacylglycerol--glycerol-3-phosphate 3-phosphatidyltransferase [Ancylobacter dichloromethanicus]|uniref:CDP-diacylglycerol--glycerol-3-phosphate 3-phosphatidyltransferase n=1 Tax=Ancylobacter dichloromethanicus TaxID=518825 RepID=A0A9W6J7X9_9HYPH|nr:CDP-diacylglycerol--glycerol-3-phosphate 3-phosphatidyltransferase [Ancylobacter dichloromethanicus]GLK70895.1 CDP-diacylglycerol--glycerol-3-phosphate 3-phosphatidyltransferase [Ancylobacter dichloromethanicus]
MVDVASQPQTLREPVKVTRGHAFSLPNLLTYGRCVAVPLVAACLFWSDIFEGGVWLRWVALAIYVVAAVTDFFDGYLARAWSQQSAIGRMLDPIADKLLVSTSLLMLASDGTIRGWSLWAAVVILCRELLVSGLREFLVELRVSVPVTRLAKWKTTAQLVAVAVLLAGPAADKLAPGITLFGIVLLWIAALLTLYTGWDYFRAGARHLIEDDR